MPHPVVHTDSSGLAAAQSSNKSNSPLKSLSIGPQNADPTEKMVDSQSPLASAILDSVADEAARVGRLPGGQPVQVSKFQQPTSLGARPAVESDAQERATFDSSVGDAESQTRQITTLDWSVNDAKLQILHSVRDDILSEIRSVKAILLQELRNARTPAAVLSQSFADQDCISPLAARRIGEDLANEPSINRVTEASGRGISQVTSRRTTPKSATRMHDESVLADLRRTISYKKVSNKFDSAAIKEQWRKNDPRRHSYNVKSMYRDIGFYQQIAKHDRFEQCTMAVLVLNAIWMCVETEFIAEDSIFDKKIVFALPDVMFYVYFFGELLIRFAAFRSKVDCCKDGWFVFDAFLVTLYTLDPFVIDSFHHTFGKGDASPLPTEALRLIRLARLSRLTRLLRYFPELTIMVKGLVQALATVGYSIMLLSLVTYVFAIALRKMAPSGSEIKGTYFPSTFETMLSLVIHGFFVDELSGFIGALKADSVACFVLAWLYIFLSSLLIMNILIGVLCEVMATVAMLEKEFLMVNKITNRFHELFSAVLDTDGNSDGVVGWDEFAQFLQADVCQRALMTFDVDIDALIDMVEDIFFCSDDRDEKITISCTQILDLILRLRGSKNASVNDVAAIGKRLNVKFHELKEKLDILEIFNN